MFSSTQEAIANLRTFVEQGGSIYVSDQAYDLMEQAFPDKLDFYGDDNQRNAAELGAATNVVMGQVVDLPLAQALGSSSIELHYPLWAWVIVESVAPDVRVFIRGPATPIGGSPLPDVPHTVGFAHGEGHVVYTSFHQEPGINQAAEQVLRLLVFEL